MQKYTVKRRIMVKRELGIYISYGLVIRNESGKRIREIKDISPSKETVTKLCETLSRFSPSALHTDEILEDFMAGGIVHEKTN